MNYHEEKKAIENSFLKDVSTILDFQFFFQKYL